MRRAFLMVAALLSLTASGRALDFEIKEVIKVGPIYGFALYPPMLWSPDGTMLAYFANNCLMIADTLGHARQAAKVEMVPDRFCWAGNGEVIVKEVVRSSRDYRLNLYDIATGGKTELVAFVRKLERSLDQKEKAEYFAQVKFDGPFLTAEGAAFFTEEQLGEVRWRPAGSWALQREDSLKAHLHVYRDGTDGIYMVRMDEMDSVRIGSGKVGFGTISPDWKYIAPYRMLRRFSDDMIVSLDTLAAFRNLPEGSVGCGMGDYSFNPRYPELAFLVSCDPDESVVGKPVREIAGRVGLFDYKSGASLVLDDLLGLGPLTSPVFHPDGRRLCIISGRELFIINREVHGDSQ